MAVMSIPTNRTFHPSMAISVAAIGVQSQSGSAGRAPTASSPKTTTFDHPPSSRLPTTYTESRFGAGKP